MNEWITKLSNEELFAYLYHFGEEYARRFPHVAATIAESSEETRDAVMASILGNNGTLQ